MDNAADGYEVFCDVSYFDYWAAREVGIKDFYQTAHFETRAEAIAWTHAQSKKFLQIDEKWSVEYDPADNDRPQRWFRHGEPVRMTPDNVHTSLFYALLAEKEPK